MYDALVANVQIAEKKSSILQRFQIQPKSYLLATVHRAENTNETKNLKRIAEALIELAKSGDLIVFPVHPRTRERLDKIGIEKPPNLLIVDPVSYFDMLILEKNAIVIVTDSGGVQKEAYWFSVPCVTVREETEWVETVKSGWNTLAGTEAQVITDVVQKCKVQTRLCAKHTEDGHAVERLVRILKARAETFYHSTDDGHAGGNNRDVLSAVSENARKQ
jgi:UDP-N-acetylglucosamine 2-epimerase